MEEAVDVFKTRIAFTERLLVALEHLPVRQQVGIITCFLSLDQLKELTEFQERS